MKSLGHLSTHPTIMHVIYTARLEAVDGASLVANQEVLIYDQYGIGSLEP